MRLDLPGLENCATGGTELEEMSVERKLEGEWGSKEDGNGFSEMTCTEVSEDCVGYGFGFGWMRSFG